jgi:hypothetical protein
MYFDITEARHVTDYRIQLRFRDGSSGVVDLSSYANQDNVFRAFLDMNYFRRFRIEFGTLVWGDGELDLAPETLYEKATGRVVTYSREKTKV